MYKLHEVSTKSLIDELQRRSSNCTIRRIQDGETFEATLKIGNHTDLIMVGKGTATILIAEHLPKVNTPSIAV